MSVLVVLLGKSPICGLRCVRFRALFSYILLLASWFVHRFFFSKDPYEIEQLETSLPKTHNYNKAETCSAMLRVHGVDLFYSKGHLIMKLFSHFGN